MLKICRIYHLNVYICSVAGQTNCIVVPPLGVSNDGCRKGIVQESVYQNRFYEIRRFFEPEIISMVKPDSWTACSKLILVDNPFSKRKKESNVE
jgi:hypothetical protein